LACLGAIQTASMSPLEFHSQCGHIVATGSVGDLTQFMDQLPPVLKSVF
jgi:hypothetical protein